MHGRHFCIQSPPPPSIKSILGEVTFCRSSWLNSHFHSLRRTHWAHLAMFNGNDTAVKRLVKFCHSCGERYVLFRYMSAETLRAPGVPSYFVTAMHTPLRGWTSGLRSAGSRPQSPAPCSPSLDFVQNLDHTTTSEDNIPPSALPRSFLRIRSSKSSLRMRTQTPEPPSHSFTNDPKFRAISPPLVRPVAFRASSPFRAPRAPPLPPTSTSLQCPTHSSSPRPLHSTPNNFERTRRAGSPEIDHRSLQYRGTHRVHGFTDEAPYPFTHERVVLDKDFDTLCLLTTLAQTRPTFHDFGENPPKRVLDLGCGDGSWIMNAAGVWGETEFIGYDMAPVQGAASDRVTWLNGNMLKGLPLGTASVDFVRVSHIALGIPNFEWRSLINEICRVLKEDGILESRTLRRNNRPKFKSDERGTQYCKTPSNKCFAIRISTRQPISFLLFLVICSATSAELPMT
ncbi:hypothetical protein BS47DRAFT_619424 [Hydnum rufescens UP504]|uniref:Methyltransferase domain-containing protein n=1 Tax=Hydnum rufescens UP504 TaxID=1448309 RepID=A0A9P6B2V7_9AGAM|nr:hypothetical protein BS47DRAFT_619424 [Hydnum rufescens UP504]